MTTAHRPQLEARNGAKGALVPTGTEHARLLPGHTELKARKPKNKTTSQIQTSSDAGSVDDSTSAGTNIGTGSATLGPSQVQKMIQPLEVEDKKDIKLMKKEDDSVSWGKTAFSRRKKVVKPEKFTNDTVRSQKHKEFLNRFVK
ncbi:Cwf15/Cwc15 cell cycle control protein [Nakaseomyces glabratus]